RSSAAPALAAAAAATLLALGARPATAATKKWNSAASGVWGTAGNWSPTGTPASGDDVLLDNSLVTMPTSMTTSGDTFSLRTITYNSNQSVTLGNIGSGSSSASSITVTGDGTTLISMGATFTGSLTLQPQISGSRNLSLTLGGSGNMDVQNAAENLVISIGM